MDFSNLINKPIEDLKKTQDAVIEGNNLKNEILIEIQTTLSNINNNIERISHAQEHVAGIRNRKK